ncbi:MAG: M20/M25/M40 family metallo-hydrolase [Pseudomonadales bacterium]
MKNSTILSTLSLSFALSLSAVSQASDRQTGIAEVLRDEALLSNHAWQLVESLTTEVGPRLAGTDSDHRAVAWAKKKLESLEFDKVWLEPVTFPIWQRSHESARIISPYPQPLHITALGYSASTKGELSGEIIAFPTLAELEAASEDTIKGKIVFIDEATQRTKDGSGYGKTVIMRYKGATLTKEKGGLAVLIRSVGTDSHRLPHTGVGVLLDDPIPAAALSSPDADQLRRILARGEAVTVGIDTKVSLQAEGSSWNVIAQLDGKDTPEEIVLIGAHLDSWDLGTGAIDDGAGVAITTAVAAQIAGFTERPQRSIRLVLFANEEQGLWGAKSYAKDHETELAQHVWASESDFGAGLIHHFDANNEQLASRAEPVLAALDITVGHEPGSGGPDIGPLSEQGVTTFRLRQNGMDYFDVHHTADDTLDKIEPNNLKQNVAAWVVATWLAANPD